MEKGRWMAAVVFVLALTVVAAPVFAADAKVQKWNVQAVFGSGETLYDEFVKFTERMKVMSSGRIEMTPHPAGAIVGVMQMHESLKSGVLQGYFSSPFFLSGKDPAFAVLGEMPSSFTEPMQYDAWYNHKGGLKYLRDLQAKFDAYPVGVILYGRESLPMKVEVKTIADFKGLKVRAPVGMIATLFARMGASSVNLPGSEVFSALDKGVVDAADWGTTSMNVKMGLHDVCKFYVEPGFHSMSALEFTVAKKRFEELDKDVQAMMQTGVREWSLNTMERLMIEDLEADKALAAKGVKKVTLSGEDYKKIRQMAQEVWIDWGQKSPLTKEIIESQMKWAKELGLI